MAAMLRGALIGLGRQALSEHLPGLLSSDRIKLIAACDTDQSAIDRFQAIDGCGQVKTYREIQKLFEQEKLDIVVAVTPHHVYREIIECCATAKVHLLKEKPFARDYEEARKFLELAKSSGIHIMTAYQRRFHPLYNAFKYMIMSLGEIRNIHCVYTISSKNPNAGWRASKVTAGGGVLVDMGYHVFDMLIWYFDRPSWVYMNAVNCRYGEYDVEHLSTLSVEIAISKYWIGLQVLRTGKRPC